MDKPPSLILIAQFPNGQWYKVGVGWRSGIGTTQRIRFVFDDVPLPRRPNFELITLAAFELLTLTQERDQRRRRRRYHGHP